MQHVAAGEHARDRGFHVLINDRAIGPRVHRHICTTGQLVLRDQANRQQHRVTVESHLGARNRTAVRADFRDDHALNAVAALDISNCMRKIERDVKIMQALPRYFASGRRNTA